MHVIPFLTRKRRSAPHNMSQQPSLSYGGYIFAQHKGVLELPPIMDPIPLDKLLLFTSIPVMHCFTYLSAVTLPLWSLRHLCLTSYLTPCVYFCLQTLVPRKFRDFCYLFISAYWIPFATAHFANLFTLYICPMTLGAYWNHSTRNASRFTDLITIQRHIILTPSKFEYFFEGTSRTALNSRNELSNYLVSTLSLYRSHLHYMSQVLFWPRPAWIVYRALIHHKRFWAWHFIRHDALDVPRIWNQGEHYESQSSFYWWLYHREAFDDLVCKVLIHSHGFIIYVVYGYFST